MTYVIGWSSAAFCILGLVWAICSEWGSFVLPHLAMPSTGPKCPMYKGLPTFRAGGITSRADYLRVGEGTGQKSALMPTYFSHNHFSSSLAAAKDPMARRTRVTVKIMEGKNLLVSDLLTGTSDPVVFLWVGSCDESEVDLKYDKRVQSTEICKHTVDPVWDAEFVFPLEIHTVQDLLSGEVNVLVRDCDDADGDVHFVDLGRVSIPLETVLTEGNIMAHTQLVQLPARWYPLQRCRGVKKSRGALKIAVGLFVGPDSTLFQDDDSESIEQGTGSALRFEHHIKRLRGADSTNGRGVTVSISPPRSRELTKRGGTTFLRPKSAPEATTLTSPVHLRQRPFELKPVQPRFPPAETQAADMAQPEVTAWRDTQKSSTRLAEPTPSTELRPRWRDTYGSAERRRENTNTTPSSLEFERAEPYRACEEPQDEQFQPGCPQTSPQVSAHARPSSKLSRLAAKATRATSRRGRSPGASASWDEQEGAIVRAHRWQRRLLESMQRLEDRSTEGVAYGELRAMVREASSTQASKVIAAARGVGASCSLSARRYTLRLLAWLCWDQHVAASKGHGDVISYVLDRARDNETASLRTDMAVCVGAVMLSALRHGTVDACMVQTRRFLRLVGEQRKSVRESAGVCCVVSVLPPPPCVPIGIQTGLRSIDDVRLAIGRAAEWGRVANVVPKEAVLLPGGCAVIELANVATAASFFDRMTATAGGLPSNWRIDPFPEDFCGRVNHAQAAHHARLTVNSEEILASLLEALGNGRSESTRGQLFDAIAALAEGFALHGGEDLADSDTTPKAAEAAATGREIKGIPATLKKGLPAIARAVLEVLDCPVRRAHTWKERKAALEVIAALAVLVDLRGTHGPLGEHRAKLIQGATRGKHDSVAAVREAATEALVALEATEADEGKRETSRPFSAPAGVGRFAGSATEMARKFRREDRRVGKGAETLTKNKTLDIIVRKAERVKVAAAEDPQYETERDRGSPDHGMETRQNREKEQATEAADTLVPANPTPSASSAGQDSLVATDCKQQAPSQTARGSLKTPFHAVDEGEREKESGHHSTGRRKSTPFSPKKTECELDGFNREPPQRVGRQSSEAKVSLPKADDDATEPEEKERGAATPARRSAGSEVKRAPIEVEVAIPDSRQLPQLGLLQAVQAVPQHQEASHSAPAPGNVAGAVGKVASSPMPAPMHGGIQADTVRLLKHLNSKTDKITSVLDGLDRRLLGVEKTLVERPLASGSPLQSPPGRKLKRPRPGHTSSRYTGKLNDATPKRTSGTGNDRSTRSTTKLKRDIGLLLERGDVESAFRIALSSRTERDVLRLMGKAGGPDLCRHRLGMETRNKLFAFLARTISAGQYAEHALPWVFEIIRAGETRCLSLAVRMQLAGALHGLAASPTDQGVVAARLGPYLSLTSVGRSSFSDATEGGGVFSSMDLGGGAV